MLDVLELRRSIMIKNNFILQLKNICKDFPIKSGLLKRSVGKVKAVENVSLNIKQGETLGLVGESGCGKTTIARIILQLEKATSGKIIFSNENTFEYNKVQIKNYKKDVQMIFQDPYSSLNPQRNIKQILHEPLLINKAKNVKEKIRSILELVNLPPTTLNKYPHELSGGQRQRVGIARALTLDPKLIVCDEPVSALDVSIRSQIINLLIDLQKKTKISYIFISHDLSLVEHMSDNIAIMYLGNIVEIIPSINFNKKHLHPYTKALISSIPQIKPGENKKRILLEGDVPSPINPPSGCKFRTRCPEAHDKCAQKEPPLIENEKKHFVACHLID